MRQRKQTRGGSVNRGSAQPGPDVAEVCSTVLDERDRAVYEAGRAAAIETLLVAGGQQVDGAARQQHVLAMRELADQLLADLQVLEEADFPPAVLTAVSAPLEQTVEMLQVRATALADDTLGQVDLLVGQGFEDIDPVTSQTEGLGDCFVLAAEPGPPQGAEQFVAAAAAACRQIVVRRAADDHVADSKVSLDVLRQVLDAETVEVTDEQLRAVSALAEEWRATAKDFAAVPTTGVPDAATWQNVVQLAQDRSAMFAERSAALESGQNDRIAAAWDRSTIQIPGWDFEPLGLQNRDCAQITP